MRLVPFLLILAACSGKARSQPATTSKIVTITAPLSDTCISFFDEVGDSVFISRDFKVVENTFQDTLILGSGVLYPGRTGEMFLMVNSCDGSSAFYPDPVNVEVMREKHLYALFIPGTMVKYLSRTVEKKGFQNKLVLEFQLISKQELDKLRPWSKG